MSRLCSFQNGLMKNYKSNLKQSLIKIVLLNLIEKWREKKNLFVSWSAVLSFILKKKIAKKQFFSKRILVGGGFLVSGAAERGDPSLHSIHTFRPNTQYKYVHIIESIGIHKIQYTLKSKCVWIEIPTE